MQLSEVPPNFRFQDGVYYEVDLSPFCNFKNRNVIVKENVQEHTSRASNQLNNKLPICERESTHQEVSEHNDFPTSKDSCIVEGAYAPPIKNASKTQNKLSSSHGKPSLIHDSGLPSDDSDLISLSQERERSENRSSKYKKQNLAPPQKKPLLSKEEWRRQRQELVDSGEISPLQAFKHEAAGDHSKEEDKIFHKGRLVHDLRSKGLSSKGPQGNGRARCGKSTVDQLLLDPDKESRFRKRNTTSRVSAASNTSLPHNLANGSKNVVVSSHCEMTQSFTTCEVQCTASTETDVKEENHLCSASSAERKLPGSTASAMSPDSSFYQAVSAEKTSKTSPFTTTPEEKASVDQKHKTEQHVQTEKPQSILSNTVNDAGVSNGASTEHLSKIEAETSDDDEWTVDELSSLVRTEFKLSTYGWLHSTVVDFPTQNTWKYCGLCAGEYKIGENDRNTSLLYQLFKALPSVAARSGLTLETWGFKELLSNLVYTFDIPREIDGVDPHRNMCLTSCLSTVVLCFYGERILGPGVKLDPHIRDLAQACELSIEELILAAAYAAGGMEYFEEALRRLNSTVVNDNGDHKNGVM